MMISEPVHPRRTNAVKLDFIPLDKLSVSKANMRHGKKPPDISDILPTVRARGVIQPIIVRPNGGPDSFEIVAGRRRFHAATIVARSEAHPSELQSLMRHSYAVSC